MDPEPEPIVGQVPQLEAVVKGLQPAGVAAPTEPIDRGIETAEQGEQAQ